jgi:signal transduction histidine kinase
LLLAACLALTACLTLTGGLNPERQAPTAVDGVLDLSSWDMARNGPARLDGQWEVLWDAPVRPGEAPAFPAAPAFTPVPGNWNGSKPGADFWRGTGSAALRLRVLGAPAGSALRLGYINAAWTLFANGRQVARNGRPGADEASETPFAAVQVVPLHRDGLEQGPLELVLVISNRHYREGGVLESLRLGPEEAMRAGLARETGSALFLAGTLFVMGLYHIALYRFRRSDPAPLLFGLYCLLWLGNYTCTDSGAWSVRLLLPDLPGLLVERAAQASFFLSVPVGYAFFRSLYPRQFPRWVQAFSAGFGGLATLLALAAPPLWFTALVPVYYVVSIGLILHVWTALILAWRQGREGAAFIFAGFLALGLAGVNDMLTALRILNAPPLLPLGMLGFTLGQAFALSRRLHGAFCAVEALSVQLESKNLSLEAEMEERRRLERELVDISEEERRRMSVNLHDGLCQLLTAARLRCSVLLGMARPESEKGELGNLSLLLDRLVDDAYDLSHGLWPLEHGPQGTGPSLSELAARLSRSSGVPIVFTQRRACESCVSGSATQLFRIAQEALTNAIKHARPMRIEVEFHCRKGGMAELCVRDDGVGRSAANPSKGGLGLGIMAHRARMIGGDLRIEDAPGGGTVVRCVAPCGIPPATWTEA